MSVLAVLDTTVLVAGVVPSHLHHAAARQHLLAAWAQPGTYRCAAHAIAETFRVLTTLPLQPRIDVQASRYTLRFSILLRCDPIPAQVQDYETAMDLVITSGLGAGAIYDCLHLLAAERVGARYLVTSNLRHLRPLALAAQARLQVVGPEAALT